MALADPQTVTINGAAKTLDRVGTSLGEGRFQDSLGEVQLISKQDSSRRLRHIVELRQTKVVSDPLFPSQNLSSGVTVRITVDRPKNGMTATDALYVANALAAWATSANLTKVIGGQV